MGYWGTFLVALALSTVAQAAEHEARADSDSNGETPAAVITFTTSRAAIAQPRAARARIPSFSPLRRRRNFQAYRAPKAPLIQGPALPAPVTLPPLGRREVLEPRSAGIAHVAETVNPFSFASVPQLAVPGAAGGGAGGSSGSTGGGNGGGSGGGASSFPRGRGGPADRFTYTPPALGGDLLSAVASPSPSPSPTSSPQCSARAGRLAEGLNPREIGTNTHGGAQDRDVLARLFPQTPQGLERLLSISQVYGANDHRYVTYSGQRDTGAVVRSDCQAYTRDQINIMQGAGFAASPISVYVGTLESCPAAQRHDAVYAHRMSIVRMGGRAYLVDYNRLIGPQNDDDPGRRALAEEAVRSAGFLRATGDCALDVATLSYNERSDNSLGSTHRTENRGGQLTDLLMRHLGEVARTEGLAAAEDLRASLALVTAYGTRAWQFARDEERQAREFAVFGPAPGRGNEPTRLHAAAYALQRLENALHAAKTGDSDANAFRSAIAAFVDATCNLSTYRQILGTRMLNMGREELGVVADQLARFSPDSSNPYYRRKWDELVAIFQSPSAEPWTWQSLHARLYPNSRWGRN